MFVYGTLRRGGSSHDRVRYRLLNIQLAFVENMCLFSLGPYPVMLHGDGRVYGDIIKLPITAPKAPCFSDGDVGRLLMV